MKRFLATAIIAASLLTTTSAFAVQPVNVKVPIDKRGMTAEQKNVADRILTDNKIGSIKHLYIISAYSGDVIIYSTVRGKVTSSGKRLQPKTVAAQDGQYVGSAFSRNMININGKKYASTEIMQDDGTWGDSIPYLYWWDSVGIYHQHYVTGGQIPHISGEPLNVGSVIINMELTK